MKRLAVGFCLLMLLVGCGVEGDASTSQFPNSSNAPNQSADVGEPSLQEHSEHPIPLATLMAEDGERNLWQIAVPVSKKNVKEYLVWQVCLPSTWEAENIDEFEILDETIRQYMFFAGTEGKEIFAPGTIYDMQDNAEWTTTENKLEYIERSFDNPKGPYGSNTLSFDYVEIGGREWLLRCAVEGAVGGSGLNFCQAHTVIDGRYRLYFTFQIGEETLEDEETYNFIMSILESFVFVEYKAFE